MAADAVDAFHVVRGKRIPGLLVDPGAASGLVGTDTLRELMQAVPPGFEEAIQWQPSSTQVTGISGQSDATLARISIPFEVDSVNAGSNVPAEYTADFVGRLWIKLPSSSPKFELETNASHGTHPVVSEW